MKEILIDKINLGLIIISFLLACLLPFELFLFGYAVLGPLHYLTETNWIVDKNYFVANNYWKYLVVFGAFIYSIPYVASLPFVRNALSENITQLLTVKLSSYTNVLMFLVFINALVFLFTSRAKAFWISLLLTILISVFTYTSEVYVLINGLLLPTIIHVYVFTILFMLYGLQKTKNKIGKLNVSLMVLLPLLLFFIDTDIFSYRFSDIVKETYVENKFHYLNANLAKILGVYDGLKFFFYEKVDLKIQIFIAFAYIYHYLNWFSKTTIIGWHKQLTAKKSVTIAVVWISILICYAYSYRLGIVVSIFLSVIHVMLEFPLNMITVRSLLFSKNLNNS
ncbi:MAG: hypothetical protein HRT69_00920 [Flavobacteriaceae bacterium]|nr:hypothetical protein [Flavobacteriaceae bacterium]